MTKNPIDVEIGKNLRLIRTMRKKSMREVAEHFGLTFQAVQKWEYGEARMSASTLYDLSKLMEVSPMYFYDGILPQHARN